MELLSQENVARTEPAGAIRGPGIPGHLALMGAVVASVRCGRRPPPEASDQPGGADAGRDLLFRHRPGRGGSGRGIGWMAFIPRSTSSGASAPCSCW